MLEDVMSTDAFPDDMWARFARNLLAIAKQRTSIVVLPGQLPIAGMALQWLHTQTFARRAACQDILDKRLSRKAKPPALLPIQSSIVISRGACSSGKWSAIVRSWLDCATTIN
jgi:hypothetical protein